MISPKPAPDAIPIAFQVHKRMIARGLSQKALALNAGLSHTYVRDLFSGKSRNPKSDQLEKLAVALGCDVSELKQPGGSGYDPQSSDSVDPSGILPLYPSEVSLIRLWRSLPLASRDQVLLRATELLPPSVRRRKAEDV